MKKQKENSREGITWSEMGKQNVQAEKVYCSFGGLTRSFSNTSQLENKIRPRKFFQEVISTS